MIKINVEGKIKEFQDQVLLEDLLEFDEKKTSDIVAAKVDNVLRELTYTVDKDADIQFIRMDCSDGMRIYQRSLSFVFIRAAMEIMDNCKISVEHSISRGLYCEMPCDTDLTDEKVDEIKDRMIEIIESNEKFHKESVPVEQAIDIFKKFNMEAKVKLMKYRKSDSVNLYSCGWLKNYFYGYMLPSTAYLKKFDLKKYGNGVVLRHPTPFSPDELPEFIEQKQLFKIHNESEQWGKILDVEHVGNLNERIEAGTYKELMMISEALHEKKVAQIADMISKTQKRLVLIAGPSSSGKTTFANRLMVQLKVNGLNPITLSTDDYFVDREFTPRDENGDYDFESLDAVDVEQFNEDLNGLLKGNEVELPYFNFKTGKREYKGRKLQIEENQIIIIEGIHGLNEKLTYHVDKDQKFKIYISALTQLNIDDHNRIPTTDSRLLRRIVRDSKYRGHDALTTLKLWPSVRRGEEKNIFPYQEEADVMFNSALVYELAVLKKHAEPLLKKIDKSCKEYSEALRLMKFLNYFESIDDDGLVMITSILKEFVGGGIYH
jgi:uridine kinase